MLAFRRQFTFFVLIAACFAPNWASAEPLTIEQAETLSKATGRPIFAVAGSKT